MGLTQRCHIHYMYDRDRVRLRPETARRCQIGGDAHVGFVRCVTKGDVHHRDERDPEFPGQEDGGDDGNAEWG